MKEFTKLIVSHRLFQAWVDRSIREAFVHGSCESVCSGTPRSRLPLSCRMFCIEKLASQFTKEDSGET